MVRRAGACVPRGGVAAAAGYADSTNLTPGYESRGYAYGPGPGPAYGPGPGPAYGPAPGPGYAYGPGPGPGYAYDTGYNAGPPHHPGGVARVGNLCWSDRDPWANTGQGYWKAC